MRVNINLKNFRNRNKEGLVIEDENNIEKIEPRRRKRAREIKEKELLLKRQNSRISRLKKILDNIKNKVGDRSKVKENLKKTPYAYYVLFVSTVTIGVIGIVLNINTYEDLNKEKYDIYTLDSNNKDIAITANADIETASKNKYEVNNSSINEKENNTKITTTNNKPAITNNIKSSNVTKQPAKIVTKTEYVFKYIKPVEGAKVSKVFSLDNVIYSLTLDMWKIHEGIDFLAKIDTKVVSIEKGKIEKVYTDSLYGTSVILNHDNGYKSIYRNLNEKVSVKEGQILTKGQQIGLVGNTAICEIKDESHLHFELIKGTDIVNPSVIGIF